MRRVMGPTRRERGEADRSVDAVDVDVIEGREKCLDSRGTSLACLTPFFLLLKGITFLPHCRVKLVRDDCVAPRVF